MILVKEGLDANPLLNKSYSVVYVGSAEKLKI